MWAILIKLGISFTFLFIFLLVPGFDIRKNFKKYPVRNIWGQVLQCHMGEVVADCLCFLNKELLL